MMTVASQMRTRWYAYHIGDLSAAILAGRDPSSKIERKKFRNLTVFSYLFCLAVSATNAIAEPYETQIEHPVCEYTYIAAIHSRLAQEVG